MSKKGQALACREPDRDVPRLVCGCPLPCPYHTVIADVAKQTVTAPLGVASLVLPAEHAGRVGDVLQALRPTPRKGKRKR